jgi:ribosome-binding protein aMBF1 (putative translation factor)
MNIPPKQVKTAQSFLGWSQTELASRLVVSRPIIAAFETRKQLPACRIIEDLRPAFEGAGAKFVDGAGGTKLRATGEIIPADKPSAANDV